MLRRRLFGWELQQWHDLCSILKGFVVCDSLKDTLIWKGSTSGRYSTKQFCKSMLNFVSTDSNSESWKRIWTGLAPLKVEVFCWQLLKGRIAVKEQLASRGLIDWNMASCTFCNVEIESVDHLFFTCNLSWNIWMYCCSI